MESKTFPPFNLTRLLRTVFAPRAGERACILIDLPTPAQMKGFEFLRDPQLSIQGLAYEVFYQGLQQGGLAELGWRGGEMYAYQITGGSNLDLPAVAYNQAGEQLRFEENLFPNYDIILCISTYSATAPLTAAAKRFGFRGATLHGLNETILRTGLAVDYNEVSQQAELLRQALTRADAFEIDFRVAGQSCTLRLECGRQEAQKSHGIVRGEKPDIANLPAGEVYFVPTGGEGAFPLQYEDGTIGLMRVSGGRIQRASLISGREHTVLAHNQKLATDPVTGELGELGFGTQELPPAGRDIQDEKILGTLHVATGRSDHLGGHLTPDKFANARNATHDDILFSPTKTPPIEVPQVRMFRDNRMEVVLEKYQPAAYLWRALGRLG